MISTGPKNNSSSNELLSWGTIEKDEIKVQSDGGQDKELDNESMESDVKDSYVFISEGLTFTKIICVLNNAIEYNNHEELDRILRDIEDYENQSVTLDTECFRDLCLKKFGLNLQSREDHQHIYSNILSQYSFDQVKCNYSYPIKELVLSVIAANDKLTEKYQAILFAEENLRLLPLFVGSQKYIAAFIEKFHVIDGIYRKLKNQVVQLIEPNKIGFFSVIALRKEQNLLDTVLVE